MKKMKMAIAFLLVAVLSAGAAGGAFWWFYLPKQAGAAAGKPEPKKVDTEDRKYISLDKVVVMLHRAPGETTAHYLAADLVIATSAKKEKHAKEQLPLLRSVAVKALSAFPMAKAEVMTVDQFASEINRAFAASYAKEGKEAPFSEVMIGKLIIE
jgi:flagellar FliL protein